MTGFGQMGHIYMSRTDIYIVSKLPSKCSFKAKTLLSLEKYLYIKYLYIKYLNSVFKKTHLETV